jgi:hypothetical protein
VRRFRSMADGRPSERRVHGHARRSALRQDVHVPPMKRPVQRSFGQRSWREGRSASGGEAASNPTSVERRVTLDDEQARPAGHRCATSRQDSGAVRIRPVVQHALQDVGAANTWWAADALARSSALEGRGPMPRSPRCLLRWRSDHLLSPRRMPMPSVPVSKSCEEARQLGTRAGCRTLATAVTARPWYASQTIAAFSSSSSFAMAF